MFKNQKGFSIVIIVIAITVIAVTAIGGVGFYVFKKNSANKNCCTLSPEKNAGTSNPATTKTEENDRQGAIYFKEWSMSFGYTGNIRLTYVYNPADATRVAISSVELTNTYPKCDGITGNVGIFRRVKLADVANIPNDPSLTANEYAQKYPTLSGIMGNNVYIYVPNSPATECDTTPAGIDTIAAVKSIF
jgi:hypothetical protein